MTDVQVSNARRIGFTALALVAFWVASIGAYSLGYEPTIWLQILTTDTQFYEFLLGEQGWANYIWTYRAPVCGLLMALIPFAFLFLSRHNSLIKLHDRRILIGGLLFAACIGCCYWLGDTNRSSHSPSRLWLLLPIIMTTAFIIVGAWRRAVRDADVEEVDEDE